jgi:hypothetical protein
MTQRMLSMVVVTAMMVGAASFAVAGQKLVVCTSMKESLIGELRDTGCWMNAAELSAGIRRRRAAPTDYRDGAPERSTRFQKRELIDCIRLFRNVQMQGLRNPEE